MNTKLLILLLCAVVPAFANAETFSNYDNGVPTKDPMDESWDQITQQDSKKLAEVIEKIDPKEDQSTIGKIVKYIGNSDVSLSVDLFDVDLFKGVGLSTRYKYEVDNGYRQGYKLRTDSWRVVGDMNLGDLIQDVTTFPVYMQFRNDAEIIFLRHFKTEKEALLAKPRTLKDLPLSADKAVKSMYPGDFVSIPTRSRIALGARFGYVQGFAAAGAEMAYVLSGDFTYQVFRVDNSKFRLKVFAGNGRGTQGGGGVRFALGVIGIDLLELAAKQIFDLDILRFGSRSQTGRLLLVDYVFDFAAPEARRAYDDILNSVYKFKNIELARRAFGNEKVDRSWMANLAYADELSRHDRNFSRPRVQRMFSGENAYSLRTKDFEFGLLVANWRREKTYVENFITTFDRDEKASYYYNPSFVTYRKNRLGIKPLHLDEDTRDSIFAVLDSNADASQMNFQDIGVSLDQSDDIYSSSEQETSRKRLYFNLPDEIFSKIDFKDWGWNQSNPNFRERENLHMYFQFILGAETVKIISRLSKEEILGRMKKRFMDSPVFRDNDDITMADVTAIAETVYNTVHDPKADDKVKTARLMELRRNQAFGLYGFGFLASLLSSEELKQNVWVQLMLFADDAPDIRFEWGRREHQDLYEQLRLLDASTNWERIDTRIFQP